MVSLILERAGLDPTILVGGNLKEIGGNVKVGKGEYFVTEAQKRNIYTPYDLTELEHDEYEEKWNGFCDAYFAQGDE